MCVVEYHTTGISDMLELAIQQSRPGLNIQRCDFQFLK